MAAFVDLPLLPAGEGPRVVLLVVSAVRAACILVKHRYLVFSRPVAQGVVQSGRGSTVVA